MTGTVSQVANRANRSFACRCYGRNPRAKQELVGWQSLCLDLHRIRSMKIVLNSDILLGLKFAQDEPNDRLEVGGVRGRTW